MDHRPKYSKVYIDMFCDWHYLRKKQDLLPKTLLLLKSIDKDKVNILSMKGIAKGYEGLFFDKVKSWKMLNAQTNLNHDLIGMQGTVQLQWYRERPRLFLDYRGSSNITLIHG